MSEESQIERWGSYVKAVLWKPAWDFYTVGTLFTVLFVGTWWRDNFASEEMKKHLELKGILPHWSPAWWVAIFLAFLLVMSLRRSYVLVQARDAQLAECNKPIPEFVIDLAKEGDEVIAFKVKNTSNVNLYEIGVVNIDSRAGEICWWENHFNLLEANGGEKLLRPSSRPGNITRFQDVAQLREALNSQPGATNPEYVGDIKVGASDGSGNRFVFTARLEFWNMYTWRIWGTDRKRFEPKAKR